MHHHSTKITLIIISLLSLTKILLCQSTTYFIHRDPDDSRETIRFDWNKGQVYTYTKASTTLKIEGSDTLTNTFEVDTITFKILKIKKSHADIRVFLTKEKIRSYFLIDRCKIDPAFDQFKTMYVDLKYIYKGQQFVLSNCDDVKAQCKNIIAYNKDCVFEDSFDERYFKRITEFAENCATLTNWFSFDLQFLFTYDGFPYPKQDTIRFTIASKTDTSKPKDPDISEDEQKLMDKLNQVHYICYKNVKQNGIKKYILREDTYIDPDVLAKKQSILLEGLKKMMLEEDYKKWQEEKKTKEEDNFEEIILSESNALIGINKVMKSANYVDNVKKSEYYFSEIKRLE